MSPTDSVDPRIGPDATLKVDVIPLYIELGL